MGIMEYSHKQQIKQYSYFEFNENFPCIRHFEPFWRQKLLAARLSYLFAYEYQDDLVGPHLITYSS